MQSSDIPREAAYTRGNPWRPTPAAPFARRTCRIAGSRHTLKLLLLPLRTLGTERGKVSEYAASALLIRVTGRGEDLGGAWHGWSGRAYARMRTRYCMLYDTRQNGYPSARGSRRIAGEPLGDDELGMGCGGIGGMDVDREA